MRLSFNNEVKKKNCFGKSREKQKKTEDSCMHTPGSLNAVCVRKNWRAPLSLLILPLPLLDSSQHPAPKYCFMFVNWFYRKYVQLLSWSSHCILVWSLGPVSWSSLLVRALGPIFWSGLLVWPGGPVSWSSLLVWSHGLVSRSSLSVQSLIPDSWSGLSVRSLLPVSW